MQYFGKSWGAPICEQIPEVPVPIGKVCVGCGNTIKEADSGLILPFSGIKDDDGLVQPFLGDDGHSVSYHIDCFLKNVGLIGVEAA